MLSEFTQEDWSLVEREYKALRGLAKKRCANDAEMAVVQKAFDFASAAHKNVRRRSGEPYIIHPIRVARICIEDIGLGYKSIAAALLHDVVEDTDYSVDDIESLFGKKIAALVDGLTKIKSVLDAEDRKNTASIQAENMRRILFSLNDDVRVVLIKLADRLHNCRTIEYMPEHKRDKILAETMYIFIPLAHRLGLYGVKNEMENIWLKFTEPAEYREITARIQESESLRSSQIDEFIEPIAKSLESEGFRFEIKKRIKSTYSVWRKMHTKQIPFEQIYDLYAVRIVYEPREDDKNIEKEHQDAFLIYSKILSLYNSNPGRYRNWINFPKSNGYEALHCTLMSHSGFWVEVQIRSRRMDDIAEKGIAAHWTYKKEGYSGEKDSEVDRWLTKVQEILSSNNLNDFGLLDLIHTDLVTSEIYVFTPKGDQKVIPAGATALDFAYQIHSRVGHNAVAAKVNMKLVPLSHTLHTGDQIEIITLLSSCPKKEWLKFLRTRHARALVIEYFRTRKDEFIKEGKQIYEDKLRSFGVKDTKEIRNQFLDIVQSNDIEELYFKVGLGIIGDEAFNVIAGDSLPSRQIQVGEKKYVLASCCRPLPGDSIIGILDYNGVIHVHRKTCSNVENMGTKHGNRIVEAQWPDLERNFKVSLSVNGIDRMGLLNEISHYISLNMGVNMRKVTLGSDNGLLEGTIELSVRDKEVLEKLIAGLLRINGIQNVVRNEL
ncbi:MAG: RelA/SpoT family protein [Bacteroidales bacterium]|nr:RelA/SpoT family protein [Bacteroidales bacterium]